MRERWGRLRAEDGFTLIEMMIVVMILGILIALTIPSFIASRQRAQDRAAQSLLRVAVDAQIIHYAAAQEFSDDNAAGGELDSIEPDIEWGTLGAVSKGVVATIDASAELTILRSESRTGTVYCLGRISDGANAGTYFTTGCLGSEDQAAVSTWPTTTSAGW